MIKSTWGVHLCFDITTLGHSYKAAFQSEYDYERVLKIGWYWMDYTILTFESWVKGMQPSTEVLDTLPVWVTSRNLKQIY